MSITTSQRDTTSRATADQVDVRGPRFAAWVTTAVLLLALVVSALSTTAAAAILAAQAGVFASPLARSAAPGGTPTDGSSPLRWRRDWVRSPSGNRLRR